MNNNQDNFNPNLAQNNIMPNNQNYFNQQNHQPTTNVALETPNTNYQSSNVTNFNTPQTTNNTFINNNLNNQVAVSPQLEQNFVDTNNFISNNQMYNQNISNDNNNNEIGDILNLEQNKFINNNVNTTDTALNSLNIDGEYNSMPKVDYTQDPQVIKNLQQKKKNTITITSEGKIFIIIILVLLLFIFVLPNIFDFIENIRYQ